MWNSETNIRGPQGIQGIQGPPGADGEVPEAPQDGEIYGRQDGAWVEISGGGASVFVSDTPPVDAAAGSLWFESDTGMLYINYDDGTSVQWVIVPPSVSAASIGAVAYTPQTPSVAEKTVARQNIYAAPLDALAYSGMQINGSMDVSQEIGGTQVGIAAGGTGGAYLTDGWRVDKSGANGFLAQQATSGIPGFVKALWVGITAPQAAIGIDTIDISHAIEGYRVARLMWGTPSAQPVTLGFWVKSSVAGTLPLFIVGGGPVQSASVTISAVNTPQWMTVTFPAVTTGVWERTNLLGIKIIFRIASSGGINIAATNGNTFEITGVVVLPGIEAPSAAQSPLIMRPYDQELLTCQRYYQILDGGITLYSTAAGSTWGARVNYLAGGMRSAPAIVSPTWTYINAGSGAIDAITALGFRFYGQVTGTGQSEIYLTSVRCDARL